MRILVVDDEIDLTEAIARGLRRQGYAVDIANNGDEAIEKSSYTTYDLVCLDLTMPGIDGLEVCQTLRKTSPEGAIPRILMLTARDTIEERIAGLDVGADDYLVKPFAFDELAARIRSLLRRDGGRSGAVIQVGPLIMDTARHTVSRDDRVLNLTAKEFAVLHYLMSRPEDVVSQEDLLEHVWDEHADPFTSTVRVTVGTLRRKVNLEGEEALLETVVGRGYRLTEESNS